MVIATERPVSKVTDLAHAARNGDLRTYAKAVHNYDFELYQDAWAEGLETLDRSVIVCPPDSFKTTTVRFFVEREIGRNPNIRVLWLMNAGEQAQKQVMTISQVIKSNNVYRAAFGIEENTDVQWTNSVLFVRRDYEGPDPTLMGTGFNGPYQGLHFDLIIIDDPTDQEDVLSPTTMALQEAKLRGVIIDRLIEGGRIVAILTRWGGNDLVPVFSSMGFMVIEMPVVGDYPWGPTLSNTRFPPSKIERLRRDKGDTLFALTFMCSPQSAEGALIKREHIGYWDKPPDSPMHFFMGVDPAASIHTYADNAAIATVGLDLKTRTMYQVDMWAARKEVPDLELEIVKRAKRVNGLRAVGLETVGFQLSLLQRMKRTYQLPFKEIPYRSRRSVMHRVVGLDRDKVGRALYLDSLLSSGRLLLNKDNPLVDGISLEAELCSVMGRRTDRDDRMDALCFACILAEAAVAPRIKFNLRGF